MSNAIALTLVAYVSRLHMPGGPWDCDNAAYGVVVVAMPFVAHPPFATNLPADVAVRSGAIVDMGNGVGYLVAETPEQIANLLDARTLRGTE